MGGEGRCPGNDRRCPGDDRRCPGGERRWGSGFCIYAANSFRLGYSDIIDPRQHRSFPMPTEVTGRWEELISRPELRGRRVKVTVLDEQSPDTQADKWLESLHQMASNGVRIARPADDSRESIY